MDQGSLYLLLERVGVLANFQLVYAELAASCSAMAAAVASFHNPKQVQLLSVFTLPKAVASFDDVEQVLLVFVLTPLNAALFWGVWLLLLPPLMTQPGPAFFSVNSTRRYTV